MKSAASIIEVADIEKNDNVAKLIKCAEDMLISKDFSAINTLVANTLQCFGESGGHSISNLSLLQKDKNSALNNSIFLTKRNKIIEYEKDGTYIPICTRNAFMKYYTSSPEQLYYWSSIDQHNYYTEIATTLNKL